jgi:hypothetical protein
VVGVMNSREMMIEMSHELASQLNDNEQLQAALIRAVDARTPAARARAIKVVFRVRDFLRGECGRTGGF